jgi:hypothetical protein
MLIAAAPSIWPFGGGSMDRLADVVHGDVF